MRIMTKGMIEVISVYIAIFLIIFVFVMFLPYVSSSNAAIPLKILYELSPYILMVGLVTLVCKLGKKPLSTYLGFSKNAITKQIFIAITIAAITSLIIIIPLLFGVDKNNLFNLKPRNPQILGYLIFKAMIFVGIGEELIFRGYFFEKLKAMTGSGIWAVILSSILFGILHYPIGQSVLQVLMVTGIGLIYGTARLKVKDCTVLTTGIAHGLHDTLILVLGYILL